MTTTPNKQKNTILLVEDEDHLIFFLQRLLRAEGYNVVVAQTGQQAIDAFKENISDIGMLLLDIVLPDFSGYQVYERIKAIDPGIAVLLMSGYPKETFKGIEHLHFIKKPMYPGELLTVIRDIFDSSETVCKTTSS